MVEGIGNKPNMPILDNMGMSGIGGAGKAGKKGDVQETKNDKGLTETQQAKTNNILGQGAPEIDKPKTTHSTREIADQIINTLGKLESSNSDKGGLFILYQILQTLQQALNKMQESMQVMRQAETNVAIANIQSEAETMEDAATFSLIMGIAAGIVQVGASIGSMVGGFKGVTNTSKAKATGEQLKTAQTELQQLKAAEQPDQAAIGEKQLEMTGLKAKMDMQLNTAQAQTNKIQGISQFIGSWSTFAKAIGDGIAGGKQADAKRIEAQTKQMDASASQTADLVKAVKDMISTVLSLMKSVNQTEQEATAQIFRGI